MKPIQHPAHPLVLLCLIFSTAFSFAQGRLDLETGSRFQGISNNTFTTRLIKQGSPLNINGKTSITYKTEVAKKIDSIYVLKNTITVLKIDLNFQGRQIHLDSRNSNSLKGPLPLPVNDLVGTPITVKMATSGHIVESNINTIGSQLKRTITVLGGLPFIKSGYGTNMVFTRLPEDLSVGKSWTTSDGGTVPKTTCKITSIFNDLVTLETRSHKGHTVMNQPNSESSNPVPLEGDFLKKIIVDRNTSINKNFDLRVNVSSTSSKYPLQEMSLKCKTMVHKI